MIGRPVPLDLAEKLALAGGNIFHGAAGLDPLRAARPMLGREDCRASVKNPHLRGSGAHLGARVPGIAGHNAAREIIRDDVA
jgi:phytoene dehydrogenase-like protein